MCIYICMLMFSNGKRRRRTGPIYIHHMHICIQIFKYIYMHTYIYTYAYLYGDIYLSKDK
jgi:hypothetical protein